MTPPLRVAFCFHDAEESGASVWLKRFLLRHPVPPGDALVVLPGPSPMEGELRAAGYAPAVLGLQRADVSRSRVAALPGLVANRVRGVRDYARLFREWKPQVVYVNSSVQVAPMLAAAWERLPLFVHVREAWRTGATHGLKRLAVRNLAQAAAFDASEGLKLFGPTPPTGAAWEVSPNGVDPALADAKARRQALRSALGIAPQEVVFLFLGTLCRRKGLHDLLGVWPALLARHPQVRLWVAGPVDATESDPMLRAFPNAPPAGTRSIGFLKEVADHLAAADFFVLPSYAEAMPISISEAMMAGTPVVARGVADVPWQLGDGRGFLFEGPGPEPLRAALEEALGHPEEAARRAAAAQSFARERLTIGGQTTQILRLLHEAVRRKSSAPIQPHQGA